MLMFLIFFLLVSFSTAQFVLNNNSYYNAVSLGFPRNVETDSFYIEGEVVVANPFDACLPIENVEGKLVLVTGENCYIEDKLRNAEMSGAIGVILISISPYIGMMRYMNGYPSVDLLRGVEVPENLTNLVSIIQSGRAWASITPQPNVWENYVNSAYWPVFSAILLTANLYLMCYSIFMFRSLMEKDDTTFQKLTFIFICLGAIIRILWLIDPMGRFRLLSYGFRTVFLTFSIPIAIGSTITVAFYWMEIFERKNLTTGTISIKKYRLHCFTALFLLLIVEIVSDGLRLALIEFNAIPIILGIGYILGCGSAVIFFGYNCLILHLHTKNESHNSKTLHRLVILGISQILCYLVFILSVILIATPVYDTPMGFTVLHSLVVLSITFICFCQIKMFVSGKNVRSQSISSNSSIN